MKTADAAAAFGYLASCFIFTFESLSSKVLLRLGKDSLSFIQKRFLFRIKQQLLISTLGCLGFFSGHSTDMSIYPTYIIYI